MAGIPSGCGDANRSCVDPTPTINISGGTGEPDNCYQLVTVAAGVCAQQQGPLPASVSQPHYATCGDPLRCVNGRLTAPPPARQAGTSWSSPAVFGLAASAVPTSGQTVLQTSPLLTIVNPSCAYAMRSRWVLSSRGGNLGGVNAASVPASIGLSWEVAINGGAWTTVSNIRLRGEGGYAREYTMPGATGGVVAPAGATTAQFRLVASDRSGVFPAGTLYGFQPGTMTWEGDATR